MKDLRMIGLFRTGPRQYRTPDRRFVIRDTYVTGLGRASTQPGRNTFPFWEITDARNPGKTLRADTLRDARETVAGILLAESRSRTREKNSDSRNQLLTYRFPGVYY